MEVDVAWLEADLPPEPPEEPPPARKRTTRLPPRRPPTLRNAAVRRETLEVAPEWLQVEGEAAASKGNPQATSTTKRTRPAWQPPTLPPPPETAARKPTQKKSAPIPREDPEERAEPRRGPGKR